MNHHIIGTTAVSTESHISTDHGGFGGSANDGGGSHVGVTSDTNWLDIASYTQSAHMQDYNANYTFGVSHMNHGLSSESIASRMGPPPLPPATHAAQVSEPLHQQSHPGHPHLHPLITNATWPSMLTNPSALPPQTSYSAPPVAMPMPMAMQPIRGSKTPTSHAPPAPRKTLTDEVRREICLFHRDNSNLKQTEIGAKFGVERSTISKVLRNKEKFLNPTERSESPVKRLVRGKTGTADIEKALSNWIKKSGLPVSDQEIRDKAIIFCQNTPGTSDGLLKQFQSTAWLEKFKQRHGIKAPKLLRRASETSISNAAICPASPHPNIHLLPSPLSAARSDDEKDIGNGLMELTTESGSYKPTQAQLSFSSGPLTSVAATASSSFSVTSMSPATFNFSPDTPIGGFLADPSRQMMPGHGGFPRQRSQTLPILDIEGLRQPGETDQISPEYSQVSTAPSSALDSPMHEILAQPFVVEASSVSSPKLRRSSSNTSLGALRSTVTPVCTTPPAASGPGSPTLENARKAVDTLLTFIQNGAGDKNDYFAVLRLTEKLGLKTTQQQQQQQQPQTNHMAGLPRIPEGEVEMSSEIPSSLPTMMPKLEPATMSV